MPEDNQIDKELEIFRTKAEKESPEVMGYLQALREREVKQLRNEYGELAERNWSAIQKFSHRVFILLSILTLVLLILGIFSIKLTSESKNNTRETKNLALSIQKSRRNSILISCEEQNMHHNQAKIGIEDISKKSEPHKKLTFIEKRKQEEVIGLFVQALVPSYNCAERLAKFTKP